MKNKNGDTTLGSEPKEQPASNSGEIGSEGHLHRRVKKMLVPVDFSECSLKALDYAAGLAAQLGAKMTVLHIVEPAMHADNYLAASSSLDPTTENIVEAGRERLMYLAGKHVGTRAGNELLVRMGRAPSEILDTAKALGADLIVMGTHGHTGLKHVLLGSTAERVLRQAACPVLTVRWAGN